MQKQVCVKLYDHAETSISRCAQLDREVLNGVAIGRKDPAFLKISR